MLKFNSLAQCTCMCCAECLEASKPTPQHSTTAEKTYSNHFTVEWIRFCELATCTIKQQNWVCRLFFGTTHYITGKNVIESIMYRCLAECMQAEKFPLSTLHLYYLPTPTLKYKIHHHSSFSTKQKQRESTTVCKVNYIAKKNICKCLINMRTYERGFIHRPTDERWWMPWPSSIWYVLH